ncbi:restriction endonuclease [Flavobacterium sp.]|uniref:McrC family protein n=1 Tax=Flavobacterium sp. TaxID=239 RepID=UPI0012164B01|nr:restriction endonuclease [Flavobacterium sp.]RZJ69218.1 MAG: restriction endonuclease [Flavobacterium sp.]
MEQSRNNIKVFEFDSLQIETKYDGVLFTEHHFNALVKLNDLHKGKYFSIGYRKITFKNYVGVVQVDGLTIEILPKIDRYETDTALWQRVLIQMLKVTKKLKVQTVDEANVNNQQIHLLDIYFEWFLNEVQLLLHQGLIKQYYKETGNVKALKGKIEFAGQIAKNLVHKERFITTHQVYGKDHQIHRIISQALEIVAYLSKGSIIYGKCKTVQLDFPEVANCNVNESTFEKLPNTRKTAPYKTAIALARLIVLNYAPNISAGKEKMLAILFDMNSLWEEYILTMLKQTVEEGIIVYGQQSKLFWGNITIRPDIIIEKESNGEKQVFVIDTKWKNIDLSEPSTHDLRQMYVYNDYWQSHKAMLLYPSKETQLPKFIKFEANSSKSLPHHCSVGKISIFQNAQGILDNKLGEKIIKLFL